MPNPLTPRQLAFIDSYLETSDGTKAAKSAGYSDKTAHVQASQLLRHPSIAAEIARRRAPIQKKSQITAERVMQELSNLAFFDPASMYDESGNLLSINEMPEETRRAIAGIEQTVGPKGDKTSKLRISSKLGSLELAAKILQMVKQEQTQQTAVQITIAAPPELPKVDANRPQLLPEWE